AVKATETGRCLRAACPFGRAPRGGTIIGARSGGIVMTRSRNIFIGAVAAGALVLPTLALADGHSEIVNAGMHAGFAAGSADIGGVHAPLHHTPNCLVRPGGNSLHAEEKKPLAHTRNRAHSPPAG